MFCNDIFLQSVNLIFYAFHRHRYKNLILKCNKFCIFSRHCLLLTCMCLHQMCFAILKCTFPKKSVLCWYITKRIVLPVYIWYQATSLVRNFYVREPEDIGVAVFLFQALISSRLKKDDQAVPNRK